MLSKACELVNAEDSKMPPCTQCDALRLHLKRGGVAPYYWQSQFWVGSMSPGHEV